MLNEEQYIEKMRKVQIVVTEFLKNKKTIREISEETKISTSSVQRYLNDTAFIKNIFGEDANFIIEEIHRRLKENKIEGQRLGGQTYALNNDVTKDGSGKFTGSRKK